MDVPRYSASPPYSFASSATPVRRSPSFAEVFSEVWRWLRGKPRQVFPTDRLREQRLVDEIAAEIEAEQRQVNSPGVPQPESNRAIAGALGVSGRTIDRDSAPNGPPDAQKAKQNGGGAAPNGPPGAGGLA